MTRKRRLAKMITRLRTEGMNIVPKEESSLEVIKTTLPDASRLNAAKPDLGGVSKSASKQVTSSERHVMME